MPSGKGQVSQYDLDIRQDSIVSVGRWLVKNRLKPQSGQLYQSNLEDLTNPVEPCILEMQQTSAFVTLNQGKKNDDRVYRTHGSFQEIC
jgi:hypothetical protein